MYRKILTILLLAMVAAAPTAADESPCQTDSAYAILQGDGEWPGEELANAATLYVDTGLDDDWPRAVLLEFDLLCKPSFPVTLALGQGASFKATIDLKNFKAAFDAKKVGFHLHFVFADAVLPSIQATLEVNVAGHFSAQVNNETGPIQQASIWTEEDVIEVEITKRDDRSARSAFVDLSVRPAAIIRA